MLGSKNVVLLAFIMLGSKNVVLLAFFTDAYLEDLIVSGVCFIFLFFNLRIIMTLASHIFFLSQFHSMSCCYSVLSGHVPCLN